MKHQLLLLLLISLQAALFSHEYGHENNKIWIVDDKPITAELLKYEDGKVFFLSEQHALLTFDIGTLSPKDQEVVLGKYSEILHLNENEIISNDLSNPFIISLGAFLLLLSTLLYFKQKKSLHLSYGFLGLLLLTLGACDDSNNSTNTDSSGTIPSNDISFLKSIFESFTGVSTSSDSTYFYVSSNGIPSHNMMVGITNWQQQVPIDQNYTGDNSWAIPIHPILSENPLSTKTNLLKGAIAIATNGIPIFNPLNNRGEDANAIGELDQWGGHCGRADDYHYHLPPTHLQNTVGEGKPIAYAVDGFPVYGETNEQLDEYLGRFNGNGGYQYHAINQYPYLIAGMRGEVTLDPNTSAPENQVIPQAMTRGVRPALEPLNGASINGFRETGVNSYSLTYSLNNEDYTINYEWDNNKLYSFESIDPVGNPKTETYKR